MIQTYAHQKQLQEARLDLKTCERQFANLITSGTNCSAFESDVIVQKAREVFRLGEHAEDRAVEPGQMVWLAVSESEPAGKPLEQCQLRRVVLTHTRRVEDAEVRRRHGPSAKRRQQILRMCAEARRQGALLTQEDLGELLDSDVRTIRRDCRELEKRGLQAATRGRCKDIGPTVTHRVKTIELFLQEQEPADIARRLQHSLTAVERYIDTFCRVVFCQRQLRDTLQTALVAGVSVAVVNQCMDLYARACENPRHRRRLRRIELRGRVYWETQDEKKSLGQRARRPR